MKYPALAPRPSDVDPDVWAGLVARVRDDAEWHIAPRVVETFHAVGNASDRLILPTLMLVSIDSVTIDGEPVTVPRFTEWGTIYPDVSSWPGVAYGTWRGDVEITVTHGYEQCPDDLLLALKRAAASAPAPGEPRGRQVAGPFQYDTGDDFDADGLATIFKHSLAGRP